MLNKKLVVIALACLFAAPTFAADKKPIKVYLMAGQSNMEGHNYFGSICTERYPGIDQSREDVWVCYPGRKLSGPCTTGFGGGPGAKNVFGPEMVMGHILGPEIDNQIIFFKSCVGGTQLHTRWRPPAAVRRAGGEVGDLYLKMMGSFHRFLANPKLEYPAYDGEPIEVAGFVWFQGENDSLAQVDPDDPKTGFWNYYEENLRDLIKSVRAELAVPGLPVLIYQIGPAPVWDRKGGGKVIRAAQKKVAEEDAHGTWVSTMDLHPKAHYNTPGMLTIGERGGKALLPFARKTVPQDNAKTLAAGKKYTAQPKRKGSAYDLAKLKKGMVAYWAFDEGTGDTTVDAVGDADGKIIGNPQWVDGFRGKALMLTSDQHVQFPDFKDVTGPSGNIENITISYWYRANYWGAGRIGKGKGAEFERNTANWWWSRTANVAGWDAVCRGTKGGVFFTTGCSNGPKGFKFNGGKGNVISDGSIWNHVVAMYNGSNKSFNLYINGVPGPKGGKGKKEGQPGQMDKPFWGIQEANHIIPATDEILMIGNLPKIPRQYEGFDEVGIWSRPLTEEEVMALYNDGDGCSLK